MSDEERQRQMDFIITQQAQLTATVGRLSEKVDRTADGIAALLTIAEIHERELGEITEAQSRTSEQIAALAEAQAHSGRRASESDERLNALINTVERFITEGRGGQGKGGE